MRDLLTKIISLIVWIPFGIAIVVLAFLLRVWDKKNGFLERKRGQKTNKRN